jgi:hypothetical protein
LKSFPGRRWRPALETLENRTTPAGFMGLGTAAHYGVLGLVNSAINTSNVTITGDVGMSQGGKVTDKVPSTITGSVYEYAADEYAGRGNLGGLVVNPGLLSQADADALNAAAAAAALGPTQSFGAITAATIVTGNGGTNVIDINGDVTASLTLSGSSSDYFIVNISGTLSFGPKSVFGLAGGVTADHVLYNFTGAGGNITSHVGNVFDGTLLAPNYSFDLDSVFNGEIVSGKSITLHSGTGVNFIGFTLPPGGSAPSVTTQSMPQTVTVGQTATFTAAATGAPFPLVKWQVSTDGTTFTDIPGATSTTYSFNPVLADNGEQFRAVFINAAGVVNSSAATLTVLAPITVANVQVNDGSAQRSEVVSITVTFSGLVNFAGGNTNAAAAFALQHLQDAAAINNLAAAVSTNGTGQTVVTLTFTTAGNAAAEIDPVSVLNGGAASLADGRYQLTILSASVTDCNAAALDGDNDGVSGGNYVSPADTVGGAGLHLYRLFGDANGDGVVDATDLGLIRSTFNANSSQANYVWFLDCDNSGAVDAQDIGQFKLRFNTNVFG